MSKMPADIQQVEDATASETRPGIVTRDPMTWKRWTKIGITLNICANAFLNNTCAAGLVPTLSATAAELSVPITVATSLMAYNVLAQGLSNIIWVPTTLCFGKRWVVVGSMALLLPCIAWAAVATSFESLLGARVLSGFASGASESFAPMIIGEIWFERDFTLAMGFFAFCTLSGATIGQTILGYVTQGAGWRWAYWATFIACAVNTITLFLWLPETTFRRGLKVGITAGDVQRSEKTAHETSTEHENHKGPDTPFEEHHQFRDAEPMPSMRPNLWFIRHPEVDYSTNWFKVAIRPGQFFMAPTVLWSTITYAIGASAFTIVGVCIPQLLGAPPYNFAAGAQGLFAISSFIGLILGGTIGSRIVDVVNSRIEQRHFRQGKKHKPEDRLIMLILPFVTAPVGLVLYGVSLSKGLPWIAPAFGYGIHSFGLTVMAGITFSYAVDSYLVRSGEIMVFNNTVRALLSFGFATFTPTWETKVGPTVVYTMMAGVVWGVLLLAIPVLMFGPRIREFTNRFV
ncbi:MFS general substrate transporter [Sarocladium strictum]